MPPTDKQLLALCLGSFALCYALYKMFPGTWIETWAGNLISKAASTASPFSSSSTSSTSSIGYQPQKIFFADPIPRAVYAYHKATATGNEENAEPDHPESDDRLVPSSSLGGLRGRHHRLQIWLVGGEATGVSTLLANLADACNLVPIDVPRLIKSELENSDVGGSALGAEMAREQASLGSISAKPIFTLMRNEINSKAHENSGKDGFVVRYLPANNSDCNLMLDGSLRDGEVPAVIIVVQANQGTRDLNVHKAEAANQESTVERLQKHDLLAPATAPSGGELPHAITQSLSRIRMTVDTLEQIKQVHGKGAVPRLICVDGDRPSNVVAKEVLCALGCADEAGLF